VGMAYEPIRGRGLFFFQVEAGNLVDLGGRGHK